MKRLIFIFVAVLLLAGCSQSVIESENTPLDTPSPTVKATEVSVPSPDVMGKIINVKEYANVRAKPSLDADILGQAVLGSQWVVLNASINGGWMEIQYGKQIGYVRDGYISVVSQPNAEPTETPSISTATAKPALTAVSAEAEQFATDNGVSVAFAESLESALVGMKLTDKSRVGVFHYDLSDVYNFMPMNDWAGGKRFQVWMAQEHIWIIYEKGDSVVGIKGSNGDTIYHAESAGATKPPKTDTDNSTGDEIRLVDGQLGEYGKKDPKYPEYVDFYVPVGSYSVKNNAKNSIVMIIDNKSNDEVSRITLSSGQNGEISVKSGQHIELTMYSDVSLTKK